jgi:hypothetical protein
MNVINIKIIVRYTNKRSIKFITGADLLLKLLKRDRRCSTTGSKYHDRVSIKSIRNLRFRKSNTGNLIIYADNSDLNYFVIQWIAGENYLVMVF